MTAGQIVWLIIDVVMGIALLFAFIVVISIIVMGRSGSTSKRPSKKEKTKQ